MTYVHVTAHRQQTQAYEPEKKFGLLTFAHIHQAESRDPSRSPGYLEASQSVPGKGKEGVTGCAGLECISLVCESE